MKILVAGVGNVLRSDDGFGVAVADRLATMALPQGVKVVETGIGGIALVQELIDGADALVVIDTVDRGRPPGTVMVIEPDIADVADLSWDQRHDFLSDMHLATPSRALMLARALGVMPASSVIIGCQPVDTETFAQGLSEPVAGAVEVAVAEVRSHIDRLCAADVTPA